MHSSTTPRNKLKNKKGSAIFTALLAVILLGLISLFPKMYGNGASQHNFEKSYTSRLTVLAIFDEGEPWKYHLEIRRDGQLIFKADSLLEYEFNTRPFPTYINDGAHEYLLLERNDRPNLSKIDVHRITNGHVDSVFSIPLFEAPPKDLDGDGIKEYFGVLDFVEITDPKSIAYNPIEVYEFSDSFFRFDAATTRAVNQKVYGDFQGHKPIYSLQYDRQLVAQNWP